MIILMLMTARTHDAFAFASLLTVAVLFPPASLNLVTLVGGIVANIIGSLIPDMDQASNRLWDLLPAGDHLSRVFRRIFIKHRTITHSLLGLYLIYKVLEWLLPRVLNPEYVDANIILVSMMVGYVSHLIADSFTKDGLPLFFPIQWSIGFPPLRALRITTGTWVESWIVLPVVGAYIFWFIGHYQLELIVLLSLLKTA